MRWKAARRRLPPLDEPTDQFSSFTLILTFVVRPAPPLPPHFVARPVARRKVFAPLRSLRSLAGPPLAPFAVAALFWSPWAWRGGCGVPPRWALLACSGWFSGLLGVCCGFVLCRFVSVSRLVSRVVRGSAGGSLVAFAGRFRFVCRCLPLARPALGARVLRRCRCCRVRVACRCVGVRVGLVVLGRLPAGGSAVPRRCGCGVGCFGAGVGSAVAPAGVAGGVACARLGRRGLGVRLLPLPLLVASVGGCRRRWLVTAPVHPRATQTVAGLLSAERNPSSADHRPRVAR